MLDFLCAEEGQAIYRKAFYSPANPKVEPINPALKPGKYPSLFMTPREAMSEMPKWAEIFKRIF